MRNRILILSFLFVIQTVAHASESQDIEVSVSEKKNSGQVTCSYSVFNNSEVYTLRRFDVVGVTKKPLDWESGNYVGPRVSKMSPPGWAQTLGKNTDMGIRVMSWDTSDPIKAIFPHTSKVFTIVLPDEPGSSCSVDHWEVSAERRLSGAIKRGSVSRRE
jgi:hypothetical protein